MSYVNNYNYVEHALPMQPALDRRTKEPRQVCTLTVHLIFSNNHSDLGRTVKALLDTGCTSSIVSAKYIPKSYWKTLKTPVTFSTKTGNFKLAYKADIEVKLPELASNKTFHWSFYLYQSKTLEQYRMFIGLDIMQN